MYALFQPDFYNTVCAVMIAMALVVFIGLHRITAGYGVAYTSKWGPAINNKAGWVIMEAPAFIVMLLLWLCSPRRGEPALVVMTLLFEIHYFQRSFIFPMLIRGKNRMPWIIILMGVVFNTINCYLIGGWFFYVSPEGSYPVSWLYSPLFIVGTLIFLAGMWINISSDYIIRHLRKPGDTKHYIPRGGMFRFVTGANYFGELTEWTGYAILSWSLGGLTFAIWTFANLAPRAVSLHKRYIKEFGDEYRNLKRRYIIPFIY